MSERLFISAAAGFESAVRLDNLPDRHQARRLHGHSYIARARLLPEPGWEDFAGAGVEQFRIALENAVAPLNYGFLNDALSNPSDDHLARWVQQRLAIPGLQRLGIQSTTHCGVDLDCSGAATVWRRYRFEAAHRLPNVPLGHKCGRMHGHGFEVLLHADLDASGGGIDSATAALDAHWLPLHQQLHMACLNDLDGLHNPTSEMIAGWLWQQLKRNLPALRWITVFETANCGAHFDGRNYRIWKELTLDSAVQLGSAPAGDVRRRIHGHTYTLRLHLSAPIDQVMGWTVDFGDVKDRFDPIFKRIDHHPLHELPGLIHADAANIAGWIRDQAQPLLPQLDQIDLEETPGNGVILAWGTHDATLSL